MHIRTLELVTPVLTHQHDFYTRLFGFPTLNRAAGHVSLQVGTSWLTFAQAADPHPKRYHFAFNIPENQYAEAKAWLRQHVELLADATGQDSFYSEDWDAHMLYFADPGGNIVELIARHTLDNASDRPFNGQSVLNISEIGIAVDDVSAQVADIQARTGAPVYRGPGSPTFTPVGDEHGLLIVVQRGRIWFPDTGVPAEPLPITVVTGTDAQPITLHFNSGMPSRR